MTVAWWQSSIGTGRRGGVGWGPDQSETIVMVLFRGKSLFVPCLFKPTPGSSQGKWDFFNSLVWVEGRGEVEELREGRFLASGQGTKDPPSPPHLHFSYAPLPPRPFLHPLRMQSQLCWWHWAFHLNSMSNFTITFSATRSVLKPFCVFSQPHLLMHKQMFILLSASLSHSLYMIVHFVMRQEIMPKILANYG